MNSTHYETHESLRDLKNEFNKNYKKYLEMSLLESLVNDVVQNPNSNESLTNMKSITLDAKIKEKYLKSNLVSGLIANPMEETALLDDLSVNDFKTFQLDQVAKADLIDKIKDCLENRLNKLDDFLTDPNGDDDYSTVIQKFQKLIDQIQAFKSKTDKSTDDNKIKYEHCLNVSFEVAKLLSTMLNNFRLAFYAEENKERCEHKILTFEVLFGKIRFSLTDLLLEVYSADKLKALKIISDQIDLKASLTREKYDRNNFAISSYKSLGKEFEPILDSYKMLRAELERQNFTFNTLKKDINI